MALWPRPTAQFWPASIALLTIKAKTPVVMLLVLLK
jgi:hypothetical protein